MLQVLLWLGVYIKFAHKNSSIKKEHKVEAISEGTLSMQRALSSPQR